MYAILGDTIEFDLITYFDGLETTFGTEYAEHALIGRKPRLQWVGDALVDVQIDLVFHASYCDPEAELLRVRTALTSHQALSFVLGNGDYRGRFVLTTLSTTAQHTDAAGSLLAVSARLGMKEYTGDPAKPYAPAVRRERTQPAITVRGTVKEAAVVKATPASKAAQAVTTAKSAFSSLSKGMSAVSAARALGSRDPLTALMRLPDAVSAIGAVAPILGLAETRLAGLSGLSGVAGDAAAVSRSLSWLKGEATSIARTLKGVDRGNIVSLLTSADSAANRVTNEMDRAALPLARLAARAATRTI